MPAIELRSSFLRRALFIAPALQEIEYRIRKRVSGNFFTYTKSPNRTMRSWFL